MNMCCEFEDFYNLLLFFGVDVVYLGSQDHNGFATGFVGIASIDLLYLDMINKCSETVPYIGFRDILVKYF